jgi:hypothetical protein
MSMRFPIRTILAASVSALALASAVQAGPLSDTIREARGDNDNRSSSAPAPAPRQSAPRADRGNGGDRGGRYTRQGPPAGGAAPSQPPPSGTVVQRRGERGTLGNVFERNFDRGSGGNGGGYQGSRRPPRYVSNLPGGYRRYDWNGRQYYNHGGHWYRPYGSRYVVVGAPYGLFVNYLPGYYSSFWFGNTRYFYADDTYYMYEPARRGYVVTRSPYGDDRDDESPDAGADEDLYVYPAKGQSEQQQSDDRYECHRWAAEQTHYDPVESNYSADQRADYLRAMTACLTGRGYSVK